MTLNQQKCRLSLFSATGNTRRAFFWLKRDLWTFLIIDVNAVPQELEPYMWVDAYVNMKLRLYSLSWECGFGM